MKNSKVFNRFLSFLTFLAILLPMIALSAYASDRYNFEFIFNGSYNSQYITGAKTDIGENSAGAAGRNTIIL